VVVEYLQAGRRGVLTADHVIFCVGGLQEPRKISYPGESVFKGTIVNGVGGEPDKVNVRGKQVLILGLGSYAVENGRVCLYRGAEHVTFLARSRTRMVTDLGYHLVLRGLKPATEVALDMLSEDYERCSVTDVMPPEIQEFKFQRDLVSLLHWRESCTAKPNFRCIFRWARSWQNEHSDGRGCRSACRWGEDDIRAENQCFGCH